MVSIGTGSEEVNNMNNDFFQQIVFTGDNIEIINEFATMRYADLTAEIVTQGTIPPTIIHSLDGVTLEIGDSVCYDGSKVWIKKQSSR